MAQRVRGLEQSDRLLRFVISCGRPSLLTNRSHLSCSVLPDDDPE